VRMTVFYQNVRFCSRTVGWGAGILLSSILGEFCRGQWLGSFSSSLFYSWREECVRFCRGQWLGSFSRRQLFGLLQAVKVWPLQGPNPHKFHL
jgi:hypothetical protein